MNDKNDGLAKLIAARLAERRRAMNLSLREVGDRMGISQTGVHDLEQGRRTLTVEHLENWAGALGWRVHIDLGQDTADDNGSRSELRRLARHAAELLEDDEVQTLLAVLRMALASRPRRQADVK